MVRAKFIPNRGYYDAYYCQKGGGQANFPVFQGSVIQRGYGLGGLIASLSRSIIPLLGKTVKPLLKEGVKRAIPVIKETATEVGKHALSTGTKTLADVLANKKTLKSGIAGQTAEMKRKLLEVMSESHLKTKKRKRKSPVPHSLVGSDIFQ